MKGTRFISAIGGVLLLCAASQALPAREYHVAKNGSDANPGTAGAPFLTISKAAEVLTAGDTVTVHCGTYREWVSPRNSGLNRSSRIVYRAAPGEEVWIKGSEQVRDWKRQGRSTVWKATVPNSMFGDFNPFAEKLWGDWLDASPVTYHLGEVYLNGKSLYEVDSLSKVEAPVEFQASKDKEGSLYQWYAEVGDSHTTIWANFHGYDPNRELVEINVRPACFFPREQGVNYITVQGFRMSQAATQWAPPTGVQKGLLGPNWSKGWIIEDNEISNSKCSGISLGKDFASGNNLWTLEQTIVGFNREIEAVIKAWRMGWNKENIGSHTVRGNVIHDCGQTGICGHLGAIFSTIEDNHIYDIHTKRQFTGAEIGCIKLHAAIDAVIKDNWLDNGYRGLWLDWQAIGTRVTGNLFTNNDYYDIMIEVTHGPCLVDNNILLSENSINNLSQGTAWVHNLICGVVTVRPIPNRYTPYHEPHSTDIIGLTSILCGDERLYNNILAAAPGSQSRHRLDGFSAYDSHPEYREGIYQEMNRTSRGSVQSKDFTLAMYTGSNLYYDGVKPYAHEPYNITSSHSLSPTLERRGDKVVLRLDFDENISLLETRTVDTDMLGVTLFSNGYYENPDGSPITIDTDYLGNPRNGCPKAGPLENVAPGVQEIVVWEGHHKKQTAPSLQD